MLFQLALIYLTADLPHYVELMRTVGCYLLYAHLVILSIYRTDMLMAHLKKQRMVREFSCFHVSHHDAIPSGLIRVAGNGFLEGFTRHMLDSPVSSYNPASLF